MLRISQGRRGVKRVDRRFPLSFSTPGFGLRLEARSLTVPIFLPANSWNVTSDSHTFEDVTGQTSDDSTTDPVAANTSTGATYTFTDPYMGTNTFTFSTASDTTVQTTTGQDGSSAILVAATQNASQQENSQYEANWETCGTTASAGLQVSDGSGAAQWNIVDSGGQNGTGYVTAVFNISYLGGSVGNSGLYNYVQFGFTSNQISVSLSPSNGLQVWDNTTPNGPTLLLWDHSLTGYQLSNFAYTFTVREAITTPTTESISYNSSLDTGFEGGAHIGSFSDQEQFHWQFNLTNN